MAGGAAGLLLARAAIGAGAALLANQMPRAEEASIDARVLLFVLAASILTGILAGAMPALRAGRTDLNDTLKEGGRSDSAGRRRADAPRADRRGGGAVADAADGRRASCCAACTRCAASTPDSIARGVLKMDINLPDTRYSDTGADAAPSTTRCSSACARCPASRARAWSTRCRSPAAARSSRSSSRDAPELKPSEQPTVSVRFAGAGYVKTMEIPMMRGRDFAVGRRRGACWSAPRRRSCSGETRIRSAAAPSCRSSRGRWRSTSSASSAT